MKFCEHILCIFLIVVMAARGAPTLNVRNPGENGHSDSVITTSTTKATTSTLKPSGGSASEEKLSIKSAQSEPDCASAVFPSQVFASHPRDDRVYVKPSKIPESGFTRAGLTKFTSAFGVHILGDYMVPDDKLSYLTELLASVLDNDQDGLVDATQNTILDTIRSSNAMMVILSGNEESIEKLLDPAEGLPPEYSCMMFLLVEQAKNIIRGGPHQKNCPEDLEKVTDRGLGFVVDFISQAAYPVTFSLNEESSMRMENLYNSALGKGWFLPQNIPVSSGEFCDEDCKRLSFQSWLATSILDQDKCSCIKANVFKLCTSEEIRNISPDDFAYFASALKRPTAYSSPAIIAE
ncbi:putative signal peptide-containing protein [Cryptosporidium canis]|uniref:Signal peptide-containing protein n=1 Tax=Cryptosporidium canis TaxID=195482 RepID=A0ABQ8P4Y8_9CRYT|nr:putative signal peptide-containing protein [Cryptosporidium canis]KAJ1608496.1 putative signal peptide-containing protein [Cryptosporidium canis]